MSGNRDFIIRTGEGPARFSGVLVLGRGTRVAQTADGTPELVSAHDDVVLEPSGGDDAAVLNAALDRQPPHRSPETVGGELNKLAGNVAIGRNAAGCTGGATTTSRCCWASRWPSGSSRSSRSC